MKPIVRNSFQFYPGHIRQDHLAEKSSTRTHEEKKKTTEQLGKVENLLKCYGERNLGKFFNDGGLEQGVHALSAAKHVMLCTGSNVAEGKPSTDGSPGLAALGHALVEAGKTVTFVTDSTNKPLVKDCLDILNPNASRGCKFETFDVKPVNAEQARRNASKVLTLREAEIAAEKQASELLEEHKPDLFLSLGLNGRGADGKAWNNEGKDITAFNSMCDAILNQANKKHITTVAVGDSENEAGMGRLTMATNDASNQARTQAGIQVTSWNANLGGEALAAGVLATYDKLADKKNDEGKVIEGKLHTAEQQKAMIQTVVDGGGVDAVTRSSKLGEKDVDGSGRSVRTGVDGFRPEVHGGMLELLKNLSDTIPPDNGMIAKAAEEDKPFIIAAFDSSAGGLIAAHNLANFILHRSHHASQFVILTDFGNAPYGPRERDDLVCLVGNGLKTAQKMGTDVIAMACNTACLSFPESKNGVEIPVVDLIATTANAIAEHGGKKPVVLSTEATAKDDMYKNRIHAAFKRNALAKKIDEHDIEYPEVVRIGAGDKADAAESNRDWASLINSVKHLSDKEADKSEMNRVIAKYVDKIPADATSVWLCCTHYPALKDQIVQRMKQIGRGHIEVIDPMEYQADEIIKEMNRMTDPRKGRPSVDVGSKNRDIRPLVITTGRLAQATNAAHHFLRSPNGAEIIQAEFNGTEFDLEAIPDKDRYGLKRFSQTSLNSNHEIWFRAGWGEQEEFNEKTDLSGGDTSSSAEQKQTTKEDADKSPIISKNNDDKKVGKELTTDTKSSVNDAFASSTPPPSLPPKQTKVNTSDSLITSKKVGDKEDDNKVNKSPVEESSTSSTSKPSKKEKTSVTKLFSKRYKDFFKKRKDDEDRSGGTSTGKAT